MIQAWQRKCAAIGVEFRYGLTIDRLAINGPGLVIRGKEVAVKNIVVCTNGFVRQLLPDLDVIPARNQVLVTNEILERPWHQSFHIREGYVYLRSIGKRVLIGGGATYLKGKSQQMLLLIIWIIRSISKISYVNFWASEISWLITVGLELWAWEKAKVPSFKR